MIEFKRDEIQNKLEKLIDGFQSVLYEEDETFLENMKTKNLAGDDIRKYQFWEWTQGVGMFGFWRLFEDTKEEKYLKIVKTYYEKQMQIGFPAKNVNTVTPMLAMSYFAEYTGDQQYMDICIEWAEWIMKSFPKTQSGGFQHLTSDTRNDGEMWDDTLFMTVLFLANMGRILNRKDYVEEAEFQFLIHIKYLTDKKTGLFFHGWTFEGRHNFAEGLWGRGNCWVTAAIPELIEMCQLSNSVRRVLTETWKEQVQALERYQEKDGMWHTLIDDPTSYVEASATCGFAFGILHGVRMGLIEERYRHCALKALKPILGYITEDGTVNQVSYGTAMGRDTKQFYKEIEIKSMPYGQALAILFLIEVLKDYNN